MIGILGAEQVLDAASRAGFTCFLIANKAFQSFAKSGVRTFAALPLDMWGNNLALRDDYENSFSEEDRRFLRLQFGRLGLLWAAANNTEAVCQYGGWEITMIDELLRGKAELESAMLTSPADHAIRREYFAALMQISRASFGVFFACLPEINTPLLFRGGTSDIWNLQQIFLLQWQGPDFRYGDYGFPMPVPHRILDLAAYCGYTAVYFANRFPSAEIVCVEPAKANFAVLFANTSAYPNIRCDEVAVWHERAVLHTAGHFLGDWGTHLTTGSGASADVEVPGYTISEILERHGWTQVDFIKCSMQCDQTNILGGPDRPWLGTVNMVTTKPVAEVWGKGEKESVLAAFPDHDFVKTEENDDILVIQRRTTSIGSAASPTLLRLAPPAPGRRQFQITNISNPHGFYRFGQAGIQLLANPLGHPPAEVVFSVLLDGQSRFVARLSTGPAAGGTRFVLRISTAHSGSQVMAAQHMLEANTEFDWSVEFDPLFGPHQLCLSTERVAIVDSALDPDRRSFFDDPRLL